MHPVHRSFCTAAKIKRGIRLDTWTNHRKRHSDYGKLKAPQVFMIPPSVLKPLNESMSYFSSGKLEQAPQIEKRKKERDPVIRKGNRVLNESLPIPVSSSRRSLPIFGSREEIIQAVRNNQVVIIEGSTGCGKTPQVPQYILDDCLAQNIDPFIICTQPRRISAISISQRVAQERIQGCASEDVEDRRNGVSYQIRFENNANDSTQLLFCTAGVLLRKLKHSPELQNVTHVILDEAHERTMDADLLFALLRDVLSVRKDLKVILMSATLNAAEFLSYFKKSDGGNFPSISVSGRTFPVETVFLEEAVLMTGCVRFYDSETHSQFRRNSQIICEQTADALHRWCAEASKTFPAFVGKTIEREFNKVNVPELLIRDLLIKLDDISPPRPGVVDEEATLIFVSGAAEIRIVIDALESEKGRMWEVFPLNASLSTDQQSAVFEPPTPGYRKIIVATNIAESSVTINDVRVVIDACRHRKSSFDPLTNMGGLSDTWISRDSMIQRRGRAGRVKSGLCFHLVPRELSEEIMDEAMTPEILRANLAQMYLEVNSMVGHRKLASDFLATTLTPPLSSTVDLTITALYKLGAVTSDEKLTLLGETLSELPMIPSVGKAILWASVLGCMEPVLTIASAIVSRGIFLQPGATHQYRRNETLSQFSENKPNDLLCLLNAITEYHSIPRSSRRRFAYDNFLDERALIEVMKSKSSFTATLRDIGLIPVDDDSYVNRNSNKFAIVKACFLAGLYPNVARAVSGNRPGVVSDKGETSFCHSASAARFWKPSADNNSHQHLMFANKTNTGNATVVFQMCDVSPLPVLIFGEGTTKAALRFLTDSQKQNIVSLSSRHKRLLDLVYATVAAAEGLESSLKEIWNEIIEDPAIDELEVARLKRNLYDSRFIDVILEKYFEIEKRDDDIFFRLRPVDDIGFVGVGNYILFRTGDENQSVVVVAKARACLDEILESRMQQQTFTELPDHHSTFIDTLCDALVLDDSCVSRSVY